MIAVILAALGCIAIILCPTMTLVFGVLAGLHAAVSACVILAATAAICVIGALIELDRRSARGKSI